MADKSDPTVYTSPISRYTGSVDTLVMLCSQHDIREQAAGFLRDSLGILSYYSIVVPGGPEFFLGSALSVYRQAGVRWAGFLAEHAELNKVVCIGHAACRWYGYHHGPQNADTETFSDLYTIRGRVRYLCPDRTIDVRAYYARWSSEGYLEFVQIS